MKNPEYKVHTILLLRRAGVSVCNGLTEKKAVRVHVQESIISRTLQQILGDGYSVEKHYFNSDWLFQSAFISEPPPQILRGVKNGP